MFQALNERTKTHLGSRWVTHAPVFYGWIIMAAATVGMIMSSPGQTYAVSIFIDSLMRDLGISRSLISGLYTAGTLTASVALPFIGRMIDQRGPRVMVVLISLIFGLSCIYMGFVRNAFMLGLGFVLLRMFGQGGLSLVSQNVINQWWVRRRGAIMGLSGLVMAMLGLAAFPNLIYTLLAAYEWRTTYMLLGAMVLFIMLPVGYFCFRSQPEQYGLQPDGGLAQKLASGSDSARTPEEHWTPNQVMHSSLFWVFSLSMGSLSMLSTGLQFHIVSIFDDNQLDPGIAAAVFVPIALTTALVNFSSGILVDRMPVRIILAGALVLQTASLLMAQTLTSVPLAVMYGVVLGASGGLQRTVSGVIWATYFGRRYLGTISGISSTMMVAGSALGPLPFGIVRDVWGSYNPALLTSAVFPFALAIVCLFFDKPRKPAVP